MPTPPVTTPVTPMPTDTATGGMGGMGGSPGPGPSATVPMGGASGGGAGGSMAGMGGAMGGGGAGGEPGSGIDPSLDTLRLVIMSLGCNGADCHGGNEFNPLDLQLNDELYTNLTESVSDGCEGLPIVDPGNPDGSALIRILRGPCGSIPQMPAGCTPGEGGGCVPDDYIDAIEEWVALGAPEE